MASSVIIDLRHVARGLDIPLPQIQAVVELLDEGNTVPFITRYRKDRTGGMNEELIREIQSRLAKDRLLAERKQTILRTIEAQGKLTEKLAKLIQGSNTVKRLEDLYLPYKPKKQTLATTARSRGLEELAQEILDAAPSALNLDARAADFVNPDKKVPTIADALLGAGHILAEQFSERAELRQRFREILQRSGKLVATRIDGEGKGPAEKEPGPKAGGPPADAPVGPAPGLAASVDTMRPLAEDDVTFATTYAISAITVSTDTFQAEPPDQPEAAEGPAPGEAPFEPEAPTIEEPTAVIIEEVMAPLATELIVETVQAPRMPRADRGKARHASLKADRKADKEAQKKKKEQQRQKAFADYFDYGEDIKKIPPHRILAINRGEKARVLRVKIESDLEAMDKALEEMCVPPEHPHADFLRGCARDALARLILPSLEREVRRELTEKAELHAVGVFARNLRNLLVQPPICDRRLLAIDPGYKSGCKMVALDPFGTVLDQGVFFLIGKEERRQEATQKILEMIAQHELQVVVIGNGTGCRDVEDFVGNLIGTQLADKGVAYVIVNEAGASVYSTSRTGREEFPQYDASVRGAISIGRRLQDPLSELVKIDPANIGVGLYQHDVKAKHLRTSLDEVVESCVNYVGVDANTASSALLRYVSGLNQLTARKVYEYRRQNGPFRSRQQLRDVPGIGEATFVQAAGFLKIAGGDNPLDATWIHPESYEVAHRVLAKLECSPADLMEKEGTAKLADRIAKLDLEKSAQELEVGLLTLKDILAQLARPGRDPREDLPKPVFKQGVLKLEDLQPGMELTGTILNVVDFGAFVDIGVHHSGLIHVSRLADKFIRDPHEVVAVGDIVKVWVTEVDKQRRRVSLTMVAPGTERTHGRRPAKPEEEKERPPRREGQPQRPPRPRPPRTDQQQGQGRPPQGRPPQGRPPSHGRPPQGRPPRPQLPPRPKKPVVPISEEMKEGKAPLRSFSDLMQFYELKQDEKKHVDSPPPAPAQPPAAEAPQPPTAEAPQPPAAEAPQPAAAEAPQLPAAEPPPPEQGSAE